MFEDGRCPMLLSNAIEKYKLSDAFVKKFCDLGCFPKCGEILKEELKKRYYQGRSEMKNSIRKQFNSIAGALFGVAAVNAREGR